MPMIRYRSKNYPSSSGPGYWYLHSGYYYVRWPDIVYSALTVGRANRFHVHQHGVYSYFEMIYRAAIIYANLKNYDHQTPLIRTNAYYNLDPSEKSAISYFLGLTFAKLLADHFLSTPWLMHLDVYSTQYPVDLWKGEKRPDLIGRNLRQDWIVMEAKGRSGSYDNDAFSKAKKQTRNIKKIDGTYPAIRVASETYFLGDILGIQIEDPPKFNEKAPDLMSGHIL